MSDVKQRIVTASFEATLMNFEGPQVILLKINVKTYVIAVNISNLNEKFDYFGSRISEKCLREYLKDRQDLRYTLEVPDRDVHYKFNINHDLSKKIRLSKFEFEFEKHKNYLPEPHFFASDHSEDYSLDNFSFNHTERIYVDGKWEVKEFSTFHGYLTDLYSLTTSIQSYADPSVSENAKKDISSTFNKPWEGGGSYLSLFTQLAKKGGQETKPELDAIRWASPGHMDILGDKSSFDRIRVLLENYQNNQSTIDEMYNTLYKYLLNKKLLTKTRTAFDKTSIEATQINTMNDSLSHELRINNYHSLIEMTRGDQLVTAKVLLATSRRLIKMHKFFFQGRVSYTDTAKG